MKAIELQIGDWYSWEAEGKKYYYQVTRKTFSEDDSTIANFEPIPLTPEILEKNGFNEQIKSFHVEGYLFRIELGISYTYSNPRWEIAAYVTETYNSTESYRKNPPFGFKFYISVFEENDRMKEAGMVKRHIHYVHELQHALRFCKLDDLADNFQI